MEENLRKSGINIVGYVPRGAHFCQFRRTKEDLMDLLVLCFKAGMENNLLCMWTLSEFLSVGEAKEVPRKAILDFNNYLKIRGITKRKKTKKNMTNIEIACQKEIHHRIKNNLQVIFSLLDLQAEKFKNRKCIEDSEVLEAFKESQNRVLSMSLIHEELYKGGEADTLNFSAYLQRLVENLFQTYRLGSTNINLNTDIEENIFFNMDTAVPLGITVNELISNSLKYAFPNRESGEIQVKLFSEEAKDEASNKDILAGKSTRYALIVSDDGTGIPEEIDFKNPETLGLQLVNILVDQLDGDVELKRDNGTEFTIRFNNMEA